MTTLSQALGVYLGLSYGSKESIEYWLIIRYYGKVSNRLKKRADEIEAIAQENTKRLIQDAVVSSSTFWKNMSKDTWVGGQVVIPFKT